MILADEIESHVYVRNGYAVEGVDASFRQKRDSDIGAKTRE